MNDEWHSLSDLLRHMYLWSIGAFIGVGQLLLSDDPLSWRRLVGRALVSGGLATAAGGILLVTGHTPTLGLFGLAAALATLGASALEKAFSRYLDRQYPHNRREGDERTPRQ